MFSNMQAEKQHFFAEPRTLESGCRVAIEDQALRQESMPGDSLGDSRGFEIPDFAETRSSGRQPSALKPRKKLNTLGARIRGRKIELRVQRPRQDRCRGLQIAF